MLIGTQHIRGDGTKALFSTGNVEIIFFMVEN
jgi:hypothetical protein